MKKLLTLLLLFPFLTSCGDDEDKFDNRLVGTWNPSISSNIKFPIALTSFIINSEGKGTMKTYIYKSSIDRKEWYVLQIYKIGVDNSLLKIKSQAVLIGKDSIASPLSSDYDTENSNKILFLNNDSLSYQSYDGSIYNFKKE